MHKQKLDKQQDYTDPDLLQKALHQLLEQISIRDQKITRLDAESTAAVRTFAEKEQSMLTMIAERDAILLYTQTQLKDREAQVDEIFASNTWKIALLLQRIRNFLVPPKSRRAKFLQHSLAFFSYPLKKIKHR